SLLCDRTPPSLSPYLVQPSSRSLSFLPQRKSQLQFHKLTTSHASIRNPNVTSHIVLTSDWVLGIWSCPIMSTSSFYSILLVVLFAGSGVLRNFGDDSGETYVVEKKP